jgi:hypothetical protein
MVQNAASINPYIEIYNARRQYREALKPSRNLKEFDKWIDNWEKAMNIAHSKGIAVTKTASKQSSQNSISSPSMKVGRPLWRWRSHGLSGSSFAAFVS